MASSFKHAFTLCRTTFNVDDWITHTPKSILAKNFGVNESIFDTVPMKDPYIAPSNISSPSVDSPYGKLEGNSSYVYKLSQVKLPLAPGGGGTLAKVDSRNFPIATTIAAAIVTLEPQGLRELHWNPNVSTHYSIRFLLMALVLKDDLPRPRNGFISTKAERARLCSWAALSLAPLTSGPVIQQSSPTTAVSVSY